MQRVERLNQAYSQAPWRSQVQVMGVFSLVLVFIALVAATYLNVSARSATAGREIQAMQSEIRAFERTNANLKAQLGAMAASSEMEKRALALGFQPMDMESTLFLVIPGYSGRQPITLAPYSNPVLVSAPVVPDEYSESLLTWLEREFGAPSLDEIFQVLE